MKRHIARLGWVCALAIFSSIGCGGRTGVLDGFGDNSGSVGGVVGGESGSTAGSGSSATPGGSGGVATGGVASGTTAGFAGGGVASGSVAFSGAFGSTGSVSGSGFGASGFVGVADAGPPVIVPLPPSSIPPAVADGCDALCAREATAMCPNQGSIASCVVGCRLLLNNPSCAMQAQNLFACEQTSPVSCDGSGMAMLDACGVQTLVSAACFLQSDNDPSLQGPCTKYCAESAAAHCPGDDPSGCEPGCQVVGNLIPACDSLWKAYVTCAAGGASLSCGSDGKAWAPACAVQAIEYLACTAQGATTIGDGGL
jgi:hypothetical protein